MNAEEVKRRLIGRTIIDVNVYECGFVGLDECEAVLIEDIVLDNGDTADLHAHGDDTAILIIPAPMTISLQGDEKIEFIGIAENRESYTF